MSKSKSKSKSNSRSTRPGVSRRSPADNVPQTIVADSGVEFLSLAAASVATSLGIGTATTKPLCPMLKAAIESSFMALASGFKPCTLDSGRSK